MRKNFTDIPAPVLGSGWADDKQMAAKFNCFVPGNITFSGESKGVVYFGNAVTFQEIQKTLNVDVDSSLNIGLFSADAGASYARYVDIKHYTQAFYFVEKVTLPVQIFEPLHYAENALNEIGKDIYSAGPQRFRDLCGNKILQQMHLGASLIATMKIDFASYYDKQTFEEHADASWGDIFSVSASIKKTVTQYSIKGQMEFSAYQSGGDPSQLAKIFVTCGSHYCVTSCDLTNLDACQSTIDGVVKYAQNNFPDQIDFKNGAVQGSASPLTFTFLDVSDLGLDAGPSALNATIIEARQTLGDLYQAQTNYSIFTKHVLASTFAQYIYAPTIAGLRTANVALDGNLNKLEDENTGVLSCYFYPTKCPDVKANLLTQLAPIDTKFLDAMNHGLVVDGQLIECIPFMDKVEGGSAKINSIIFPVDSNSHYFIASKPGLELSVSVNESTLLLGGTSCPASHKSSNYDQYNIDLIANCCLLVIPVIGLYTCKQCAPYNPSCKHPYLCGSPTVDCMSALGGVPSGGVSCDNPGLFGQMIFKYGENPL